MLRRLTARRPQPQPARSAPAPPHLRSMVVMPALAIEMVCCSMACGQGRGQGGVAGRGGDAQPRAAPPRRSTAQHGPARPAWPSALSAHLVDGHPVLGPHLVKLVDAHHAAVGQHHGAALQVKLTGGGVAACVWVGGRQWLGGGGREGCRVWDVARGCAGQGRRCSRHQPPWKSRQRLARSARRGGGGKPTPPTQPCTHRMTEAVRPAAEEPLPEV